MSSTNQPPRVGMRAKYKIAFSPYLWVKDVDLANPNLHAVAQAIADVVDPDGGYCWMNYTSIGRRARYLSHSTVKRAVNTLCEYSVARKITGEERIRILDEANAFYDRDQPPPVLELLIPASAYSAAQLTRVNLMRSDRGRPPITPETRPDITGLVGEPSKGRSDKGKSAPQRRRKDVREDEAEAAKEQPSLHSAQDAAGPPEDPFEDTPLGLKDPGGVGLKDPGGWVSETPYPSGLHPRETDPDSIPSVGAPPQESETAGRDADGTDESEGGQHGEQVPARQGRDAEVSAAEQVVDGLLRDTAGTAEPLADPVGDRERLVALAQAALDRMSPARLREITSVALHNVQKQWALASRLEDPEAFVKVRQPQFGRPMGGPTPPAPAHPRCATHPTCSVLDIKGRCAECAEEERLRALEEGEIVEYTYDARDECWRDHTGEIIEDFAGMSEGEVQTLLSDREQARAEEREATKKHAADTAAAIRQHLNTQKPTKGTQKPSPGLASILKAPGPDEYVEPLENDSGAFEEPASLPKF